MRVRPCLLVLALALGCSPPDAAVGVVQSATSSQFGSLGLAGLVGGAGVGQVVAVPGDLDGDGLDDALVQASGLGEVFVLAGPGDGGITQTLAPAGATSMYGAALDGADLDGDGYADAVIGDPGSDSVHVYLGGPSGLGAAPDITLSGSPGTGFGASVACGDVTGDGVSDVVVGAPTDWVGGWQAGAIFLFPGGAAGPNPTPLGRVDGATFEALGAALASGDVDADGFDDIAVQAALAGNGAGAVRVVAGTPMGFGPLLAEVTGAQNAEQCGASISLEDLDGDSTPDLAIGCPGHDGADLDAGLVQVWLSSASGPAGPAAWTAVGDAAQAAFGSSLVVAAWPGLSPSLLVGAPGDAGGMVSVYGTDASGPGDLLTTLPPSSLAAELGASVAAGDLDGAVGSELVLGAPGALLGLPGAGAAWVVDGGLLPFETASTLLLSGGIDDGTAGDFDGDGRPELAVAKGMSNAVTLLDDLVAQPSFAPAWSWPSYLPLVIRTAHGDLDGDGDDELILGGYTAGGGSPAIGVIKVYEGDPVAPLASEWTSVMTGRVGLGWSVAAGDLDGDGLDDMVAGAPGTGAFYYSSFSPGLGHGAVDVRYGTSGTLPLQPDWTAAGSGSDNLGYSVDVAPDLNGDGYDDLVVGAPYAAGLGRVDVYAGGPNGLGATPMVVLSAAGGRIGHGIWGLGDLDGDGLGELGVLVGGGSATAWVAIHAGSVGGLSASPEWVIDLESGIGVQHLAPLPGPTTADPTRLLLSSSMEETVRIVTLGSGGLVSELGFGLPGQALWSAVADLDGDSRLDLVHTVGSLVFHAGTGSGRLTSPDALTVAEGGAASTLDSGASSVRTNDDLEWVVSLLQPPLHGVLTQEPDGTFSYVHDGSDSTADSWTYALSDAGVSTAPELVTITVLPVDDPPVPDPGGPYTVDETSPLTLDGSGSTDDGGAPSVLWDCDDDGQFETLDGSPCSWPEDGQYEVPMVVADSGGHAAFDTAQVTVVNVNPSIDPAPAVPIGLQYTPLTVDLDGGDVGPYDPTTWSVTSTPASSIAIHPITGTIDWTPQLAGVFSVEVTLTDDEGGTDTSFLVIDVQADADADGMGDGWESEHGLDPTVDDAAGDLDADGRHNLMEFLAGTEPDRYDGPTAPILESPSHNAVLHPPAELQALEATSPVGEDLTYRVQLRDESGPVLEVAGLTAMNGTVRFAVPETLPEGAYEWRVRAVDPFVPGGWSGLRSFTLDTNDDPPSAPTVLFPRSGDSLRGEVGLLVAGGDDPEGLDVRWVVEQLDADDAVVREDVLVDPPSYRGISLLTVDLRFEARGLRVSARDSGGQDSPGVTVPLGTQAGNPLSADLYLDEPDSGDLVSRTPRLRWSTRDTEEGRVRIVIGSTATLSGPDRVEITASLSAHGIRSSDTYDFATSGTLLAANADLIVLAIAERADGTAQAPPELALIRTDDRIPPALEGDTGCSTVRGEPSSGWWLLLLLLSRRGARAADRRRSSRPPRPCSPS